MRLTPSPAPAMALLGTSLGHSSPALGPLSSARPCGEPRWGKARACSGKLPLVGCQLQPLQPHPYQGSVKNLFIIFTSLPLLTPVELRRYGSPYHPRQGLLAVAAVFGGVMISRGVSEGGYMMLCFTRAESVQGVCALARRNNKIEAPLCRWDPLFGK